jgi:hypothetical protein
VTAGTVVLEPKAFNKGLLFIKDTDILLSGDKWTIVMNIALDDHDTLVYMMKMTLYQISQKIQLQKNPKPYSLDIHWDEINRLITIVQRLDIDLQGFRKLLFEETLPRDFRAMNTRTKRELLDIIGVHARTNFGCVSFFPLFTFINAIRHLWLT